MHIICLKHLLELVKPLSNAIKESQNNLFKAMFEVGLNLYHLWRLRRDLLYFTS